MNSLAESRSTYVCQRVKRMAESASECSYCLVYYRSAVLCLNCPQRPSDVHKHTHAHLRKLKAVCASDEELLPSQGNSSSDTLYFSTDVIRERTVSLHYYN